MNENDVHDLFRKQNAHIDEIAIFGIRDDDNPTSDLFNDTIGIMIDDSVKLYQGTTDPGMWWTLNPVTYKGVTGAAHLCEGFYEAIWRIGIHAAGSSFAHEALISGPGKIKFWRDTHKTEIQSPDDPIQEDYNYNIGIHCHRAGLDDPIAIGMYSAGCQVIRHHEEQQEFMRLIKSTEKFKKLGNQALFNYLLINKKSL